MGFEDNVKLSFERARNDNNYLNTRLDDHEERIKKLETAKKKQPEKRAEKPRFNTKKVVMQHEEQIVKIWEEIEKLRRKVK